MIHALDGCDLEEALRLIRECHYSHSVPSGKRLCFGLDGAIVIFAIPANRNISRWLLGEDNAVWELSRLWAPDGHRKNLLTEAIAASVRGFRAVHPEVEALVSYADPNVGHRGGVYEAASWVPLGSSEEARYYRNEAGQVVARRAFHSGRNGLTKAQIEARGYVEMKMPGKFRFARGMTRRARRLIARKAGLI